jgi:UDP-4-amino-4,6-dideoxy-N-acetyl-beta-L-altrosamine N-acetyltransferase
MNEFPSVYCRLIRQNDLEKIMNWRMQPDITRYMNTDPALSLEDQKKWFSSVSRKNPFFYWIISVDGRDAGVIQIVEYTENECEWGYYVADKSVRSVSLAVALELSLYDYIFAHTPVDTILSQTFSLNASVVRLHELCGCDTKEILKNHVHKNGESFDITVQVMPRKKWTAIKGGLSYHHIDFEAQK